MKYDQTSMQEVTPLSEKDCFYIADRHKTEFTYPLHSHDESELNFISNATGVKRTVGDSTEIIGDYDLVLITGKNLEHVWEQNKCTSKDIREITIQFSSDLFFNNFIEKNQFDSIRAMLDKAQRGISFPLPAVMKVYPMLDKLSTEPNSFYAVINFLTVLYELSLFNEQAKILSSSASAKNGNTGDNDKVLKVQKYINDNYKKEIRLTHLAQLSEMNTVAFSRFFKLRTGRGLSDYIIDIRLGHAMRMLIDSAMPISEICYQCGFKNLSNFNRLFKKKKNCSPKEFRGSYKKKKKII